MSRRTTRTKSKNPPRAPRKPRAQQPVQVVYPQRSAKVASNNAPKRQAEGLFSGIGMGLGGLIGGPAGAAIGGAAGNLLAQITGFGEYKLQNNVLAPHALSSADSLHGINGSALTIKNRDTTGGTVIARKEYITDIITSSSANTFKIQNFFINPAQAGTFSWLSQIADNYEEWAIEGMIFEFRSTSSDALNSTNTALGTVIMATDYNAATPNFVSKVEMEDYAYGQSAKPSVNQFHFIECAHRQSVSSILYCRPGSVPSGQDQRLYDWGNFQIATTGFQGTSVNIGELWVHYQVALLKPKLFSSLGLGIDYFHYANLTGVTAAAPFGTVASATETSMSNIDITMSATTITFPISQLIQTFMVIGKWFQASAAVTYPTLTATNCTIASNFSTSAGALTANASTSPNTAETSISFMRLTQISTSGNGLVPTLAYSAGSSISGSAVVELFVIQIPNGAN